MEASELIRRNYTDEEFNKLKNSNNTVRKTLGWHTPPTGISGIKDSYTKNPFGDEIVEIPKQENYVSLRNTYNFKDGKNYWEYQSSIGCIGFINRYVGDDLDTLIEVDHPILENKVSEEKELWTELSDSFYQRANDYKDGKIDYRFIWLWFQEQHKKYKLERI